MGNQDQDQDQGNGIRIRTSILLIDMQKFPDSGEYKKTYINKGLTHLKRTAESTKGMEPLMKASKEKYYSMMTKNC